MRFFIATQLHNCRNHNTDQCIMLVQTDIYENTCNNVFP